MAVFKAILGFLKRHFSAILAALAGFALEWFFARRKPIPSSAQHQADQGIGALHQKAKDEQQAATEVPPAVWPSGDKASVINELKKDGVLK